MITCIHSNDHRHEMELPKNLPLDLRQWLDQYCSNLQIQEENYWQFMVSANFDGQLSTIWSSCCIEFGSLEQSLRGLQANLLNLEITNILAGGRK